MTTLTPHLAQLTTERDAALSRAQHHRAQGNYETAAGLRHIAAGIQRAIDILTTDQPSEPSEPSEPSAPAMRHAPLGTATPARDLTAGQTFSLSLDPLRTIYTYTGQLDSQGYHKIKPTTGKPTVTTWISPNTKVFITQ
jgi:hypothetical protein